MEFSAKKKLNCFLSLLFFKIGRVPFFVFDILHLKFCISNKQKLPIFFQESSQRIFLEINYIHVLNTCKKIYFAVFIGVCIVGYETCVNMKKVIF